MGFLPGLQNALPLQGRRPCTDNCTIAVIISAAGLPNFGIVSPLAGLLLDRTGGFTAIITATMMLGGGFAWVFGARSVLALRFSTATGDFTQNTAAGS